MWLAKRLFARIPEIERITLADVKPLAGRGSTESTNPGQQHLAELASIEKPVDAVRLDYSGASDGLVADWTPVKTAAAPPGKRLALGDYGIVVVGVPEEAIAETAEMVLPRLTTGAHVFDICSTKRVAVPAMLEHAPEGVSVLGTHPLFGPAVPDLVGQVMVVVPTERTDQDLYLWYSEWVRSFGAVVEEVRSQDHDLYMLFIQTLTHFSYLVFGRTLAQAMPMGFDLAESFKLSTPPYGILAAFTARIIGGNPRLYSQIQSQPGSERVRALFVKAAQELAEHFSGSHEEIQHSIQEIIDSYRGADVARAYANSRALVDSVQQSYRELYRRKESGELTVLEAGDPLNAGDPLVTHVGLVTDVDGQSVELLERKTVVDGRWFIAYDEESEAALRVAGRNVRSRKTRILRHNIRRVLTSGQTMSWREANLKHHQRDIAVLTDRVVDIENLCDVLTRINTSIVSGTVHEPAQGNWLRHYGMHNKLVRLTIFGDRDPGACLAEVRRSLRLFGVRTAGG